MEQFFIGQKALIIDKEGRALIIRRDKSEGKLKMWDLPGGRLNFSETLTQGLAREVKEEVGMKLSKVLAPLTLITFLKENDRNHQILRIIYLCKATGKVTLSSEHSEHKWINIQDYKEYSFVDEDYYLAFERLIALRKSNNIKFFGNNDFLGKGMTNESIKYLNSL